MLNVGAMFYIVNVPALNRTHTFLINCSFILVAYSIFLKCLGDARDVFASRELDFFLSF